MKRLRHRDQHVFDIYFWGLTDLQYKIKVKYIYIDYTDDIYIQLYKSKLLNLLRFLWLKTFNHNTEWSLKRRESMTCTQISDDAKSGKTGDALCCALRTVMNHECKVIAHWKMQNATTVVHDKCTCVVYGFGYTLLNNWTLFFFFFFVVRHSFTIEDLVSAPNLKLGCAVILRGCASDYK